MLFTGKILICRPQEQADKLAIIMQAHGLQPIVFPTVDIQPIDVNQKFIPLSKSHIQQADIILIQSASSLVYLDKPSLDLLAQSQVIYAMGSGTQENLLTKNIISRWVASNGFASEQILNQPPITNLLSGSKILLLTGEDGRSVLEPELTKKGFECKRVNTYKRVMPLYTQQQINQVLNLAPEMVLATSVDILKNLLIILQHNNLEKIKNLPLLVISPRIQQAALELGWQGNILLAKSARSEDIISVIKGHNSRALYV